MFRGGVDLCNCIRHPKILRNRNGSDLDGANCLCSSDFSMVIRSIKRPDEHLPVGVSQILAPLNFPDQSIIPAHTQGRG
jgi:hypothetical protein